MKWVLVVVLTLVLGVAGLFVWLRYFEMPETIAPSQGTIRLPQLSEPVDVYTDAFGVPHVFAANESDLFFATGYIQASERLYKMDNIARAVEGRFAEVLGPDLLPTDRFLRTWGFFRVAEKITADLDDEYRDLLQRAVDGINAYIENNRAQLPVEFRVAGYQPLRWRIEHIIGYARLMAHDLTLAWMPEVMFGAVVDKLSEQHAMELYPVYPDTKPFIVPPQPENLSAALAPVLEAERKVREITGGWGSMVGSNSWVLDGSRTESGKPLLANDPHLGFTQPAVWFEMHLVGGRFDVAGVTLAGVPLVIIGQNQSIAWGFTNVMTDDMDFYVEKVDPDNPDRYMIGDRIVDMELHYEKIRVKGENPVDFIVQETHHGPIINQIHGTVDANPQLPLAMSWTGSQATSEVEALFKLNLAKDWESFSEATALFKVPGQNMIYADTAGNIGWRPAVMIPKRAAGTGLVPMPGEDPQWDWQGFVAPEELPFRYNPPEGFIATANNKTVGPEFPHYISAYWAPPARITRIVELLSKDKQYTVDDMARIQLDVLSDHARDLVPFILKYGRPAPEDNPELTVLLDILEDWRFQNNLESVGASVFNTLFLKLVQEVYGDEVDALGRDYEKAFLDQGSIVIRNLQFLFERGESVWFDDRNTADLKEGPREIVLRALAATQAELDRQLGSEKAQWQWSKLHSLTHPHPMGEIRILDRLLGLNVGPFEMPGSNTTVLNMEYELTDPFKITLGPSMRHIHDFSTFTTGMRSILPTGQSGNPFSPHYADQALLYNSGGYRILPTDMQAVLTMGYDHLMLRP